METKQEKEWIEAQKIEISVDLLAAAKQQLRFLAAVDRNRWLYEGPALDRAIYRYNACWLPLLAKHNDSKISDGPLVVPLDCEWVWHCHRLNPVQYKSDCEDLYGKILHSSNILSSTQVSCNSQSEETWSKVYPNEQYNIELTGAFSEDISQGASGLKKSTKYDLISAVKRQSPFFYQVSRPSMDHDIFLQESVARYKGFLHLIKRNRESSIKCFCVPTYDIDLIWHTHQLHPVSYCKDLTKLLGKVLEHDDMDSDRTKGKKLDVGFSETTKQWEETFGTRYWRAGAMYRGSSPAPVTVMPCIPNTDNKIPPTKSPRIIQLKEVKVVEILLEIVGVRNLPEGHKGSPFVLFSKSQPDAIFNARHQLPILSESGEKQVAYFQCEPTGDLFFELFSQSSSSLPMKKSHKAIGSTSLSLQEFLSPITRLSVEKWFDLVPAVGNVTSEPISLRIGASFTLPVPAVRTFDMIRARPLSTFSCLFSLPRRLSVKSSTSILDEYGSEVISLQLRGFKKSRLKESENTRKEVIGITGAGERHVIAEYVGSVWSLLNSCWSLELQNDSSNHDYLFQLKSDRRMVKLFSGRKLGYEPRQYEKGKNKQGFITAVEFSAGQPYGKAVALFSLRAGIIKSGTLERIMHESEEIERTKDVFRGYQWATSLHGSIRELFQQMDTSRYGPSQHYYQGTSSEAGLSSTGYSETGPSTYTPSFVPDYTYSQAPPDVAVDLGTPDMSYPFLSFT